jgi:hypothetical protein
MLLCIDYHNNIKMQYVFHKQYICQVMTYCEDISQKEEAGAFLSGVPETSKEMHSFPMMSFHKQERKRSSPGRASRVWEGRRLVLARVGIIAPLEPGEDKPSPLPYTSFLSLLMLVVTFHYREGATFQSGGPLPINRETTNDITRFGRKNSLSRRVGTTSASTDAINRATTTGEGYCCFNQAIACSL